MLVQVHRYAARARLPPVPAGLSLRLWTCRVVFFWVDFLGTISLLPDIFVLITPETAFSLGALNLARAGRSARLGGRVALLVRALRVKEGQEEPQVSLTSKLVTELMAKRVVVLVLVLIMIVPALSYFEEDKRHSTALEYLESQNIWHAQDPNNPQRWTEDLIKQDVVKEWENGGCSDWELDNCDGFFIDSACAGPCQNADVVELLYLRVANWTIIPEDTTKINGLRNVPQIPAKSELEELVSDSQISKVIFSTRNSAVKSAWKNLMTTVVVLLYFMFGGMVFKMVVDLHVTEPIERVTDLVDRLTMTLTCLAGQERSAGEMEHLMVAFRKMGDLLVKVYGEAGAQTIQDNIALDPTSTQINAMTPGKIADYIFGFCDIREFTAATECLEEDVMIFVNGVGQIVHDIVVANGGFPNKNVGDAFLVVWRPPEGGLEAIKTQGAEINIADKALTSIVQSAEYVNYNSKLSTLLDGNEKLQAVRKTQPCHESSHCRCKRARSWSSHFVND